MTSKIREPPGLSRRDKPAGSPKLCLDDSLVPTRLENPLKLLFQLVLQRIAGDITEELSADRVERLLIDARLVDGAADRHANLMGRQRGTQMGGAEQPHWYRHLGEQEQRAIEADRAR